MNLSVDSSSFRNDFHAKKRGTTAPKQTTTTKRQPAAARRVPSIGDETPSEDDEDNVKAKASKKNAKGSKQPQQPSKPAITKESSSPQSKIRLSHQLVHGEESEKPSSNQPPLSSSASFWPPSKGGLTPSSTARHQPLRNSASSSAYGGGSQSLRESKYPMMDEVVGGEDPFVRSVAKSFLASQDLLRTKLETLKQKLAVQQQDQQSISHGLQTMMMSSSGASHPAIVGASAIGDVGASSMYSSIPTLHQLKSEFQVRQQTNQDKVIHILRERYPDMDMVELQRIVQLYG
jgi:hypothetical protein